MHRVGLANSDTVLTVASATSSLGFGCNAVQGISSSSMAAPDT
jgi:hypothetical protein